VRCGQEPRDAIRCTGDVIRAALLASALIAGCGGPALQNSTVTPEDSRPSAAEPNYPAPIPAGCSVAAMRLDQRYGFGAYWIDGVELAAGLPTGVLREGENKIQWQGNAGDVAVGGRALDGAGTVRLINPSRLGVGIYSTSVAFSHPGCWQLTATMGAGSLDAIVYVFPQ
jgi:hypothetical protein